MSKSITSANAIFTMTIDTVAPVAFVLENWSVDSAWETEAYAQLETRMSMDGYLNVGFVWRSVNMTLTLQPGSSSIDVFRQLQTGQMAATKEYRIGGTLHLPSINQKFTLTNGVMKSGSILPNGGETLAEQAFNFEWERVYPAAI